MSGKRIIWIDIAKSLAIILVVLGHVWRGLNEAGALEEGLFVPFDHALYYFHMPLFLMISGFLFAHGYKKEWPAFLKRQAVFIIWPCILWSIIMVSLKVIMSSSVNNATGFESLLTILYKPVSIFWFLYVLFLSQCLVKIIYSKIPSSGLLALLGVSLFLISFYADFIGLNLAAIPALNLTAQFSVYFIAGFILAQLLTTARFKELPFINLEPNIKNATLAIGIFVTMMALLLSYGVGLNSLSAPLIGIVMSYCVIVMCSYMGSLLNKASPNYMETIYLVSMSTMAIYVSHIIFTAAVRIILFKLGIDHLGTHVLIGTTVGFIAPIVMYIIASKLKLTTLLGLGLVKK